MSLYRAFLTVGGLTGASRVLGFVRDVLTAAVLGTGWVADAFVVAFRIPNLFRALFAEGAFNAAFVPLFAKRLEHEGETEARRFAEEALALLVAALVVTLLLAQLVMPWLVSLIAPGFTDQPEKFALAVVLTRITFIYLLCISLVALAAGVLNALGRFAAAAAAPILLNLVMATVLAIAAWIGFYQAPEAGLMLAWGVALAGFAQLLLLAIAASRQNMNLRFRRPRFTPGMKRLALLGLPGVAAAGITQINVTVGTMIASLQESAVSYLYYADRLNQLPLGIVGIAIGVVLLPELSRQLAANNVQGAMASQNRSLEFALLLTLPAAAALIVIPLPIIQVLFERGAFEAGDSKAVAAALAAYAAGLPAFVMTRVFLPGFFAREDVRTPMIFTAAGMLTNVGLALFLFPRLGHVGLAAAASVAGWLNTSLLFFTLVRRGHFKADKAFARRVPLIVVSAGCMSVALWFIADRLAPYFAPDNGTPTQVLALGVLVGAGMAVYAVSAQVTGAFRYSNFKKAFARG